MVFFFIRKEAAGTCNLVVGPEMLSTENDTDDIVIVTVEDFVIVFTSFLIAVEKGLLYNVIFIEK